MRSAWLAALLVSIVATEANAAGWQTVVLDARAGSRVVGLRGETATDAESGLMVMCAAGATPSIAFATAPTRDFSVRPGDSSPIMVGDIEISVAAIQRNDSTATVAVGEIADLPGLLETLSAAESPAKVALVNVEDAAIDIPRDGLDEAILEFKTACQ